MRQNYFTSTLEAEVFDLKNKPNKKCKHLGNCAFGKQA